MCEKDRERGGETEKERGREKQRKRECVCVCLCVCVSPTHRLQDYPEAIESCQHQLKAQKPKTKGPSFMSDKWMDYMDGCEDACVLQGCACTFVSTCLLVSVHHCIYLSVHLRGRYPCIACEHARTVHTCNEFMPGAPGC